MNDDDRLFDSAKRARNRAHAPYSGFHVGAAILDENGYIHAGCNVENAAYPEGICAEANAIGSMITKGGTRIRRIAILGGPVDPVNPTDKGLTDCTPCGGCRQKILEFADSETIIVLEGKDGQRRSFTIADLLPNAFHLL